MVYSSSCICTSLLCCKVSSLYSLQYPPLVVIVNILLIKIYKQHRTQRITRERTKQVQYLNFPTATYQILDYVIGRILDQSAWLSFVTHFVQHMPFFFHMCSKPSVNLSPNKEKYSNSDHYVVDAFSIILPRIQNLSHFHQRCL